MGGGGGGGRNRFIDLPTFEITRNFLSCEYFGKWTVILGH